MNIKKVVSFILSAVITLSITTPYLAKNETVVAVGNTAPPTFMESEPEIIADSSLGSFIVKAMKSEDIVEAGEQDSEVQYSGDYGIEDITYDPDTNTLSLFTWQEQDCTAIVGFYTDDGKRMYSSEKVNISQGSEVTTIIPDTSKLPGNFLIEAYLINDQLMPLSNSYVYNKMTREMQEILAKTVNDFDPSLVVQIDETDDTNNFYVLSEGTILIDSTSDTNTIVSADFETGTYVFSNIDDSMRDLAVGDIFSVATDEGVIAAEIEDITIDSDTATIVGTSDKEELFQFIKINTSEMDSSLFEGYTLDMSQADEGVSLSDKSFDETPVPEEESTDTETDSISGQAKADYPYMAIKDKAEIRNMAPKIVSLKGDDQASVSLKAEPTFTIAEKKGGASGNGISGKINFVVSVPIEIKAEFYFSLGYSSFELKSGYGIKAKGSASIKGEFKIPLASIDFPVAGVLHLGLIPQFVIEGNAEASVTVQKSFSAGFKWDTNTWELKKSDGLKLEVEDKLELNLESSLFIGIEFEFTGYILTKKTCSVSFPLDVGVKIKAKLPIAFLKITDTNGVKKGDTSEWAFLHLAEGSTEESPDTLYNCDSFVEIDADIQIELSGDLAIADYAWNPWRDKMKIKAEILEYTKNIGKFYFVTYPDKATGRIKWDFGKWDSLKGKDYILYKTTVTVYDQERQPLSGVLVNNTITTDAEGKVVYYLPPGIYEFNCSYYGQPGKKRIEITNKSRKVSLIIGDDSSASGSDSPYKPGNQYEPTDPRSPEAQNSLKYLFWEENDEGGITITDCDESAVRITIPREIDGKPVTRIGDWAFVSHYSLTSITIPDSVTSIGMCALYECESLTSITIPDSVTSIGESAFALCYNLTSITIPDSVTSIGDGAFFQCESLTSITIPDSVTFIADNTFCLCCNLTDVSLPSGVTSIGSSAFEGCNNLTDIIIPSSVRVICNEAFRRCDSLTSITIPDSVTNIGGEAFKDCESLRSITIKNPNCTIDDYKWTICNRYDSKTDECFFTGTIYGYEGSTAQAYAERYGYNFEPIGEASAKVLAATHMPRIKADAPNEVEYTFTQEVTEPDIYNFYVFADENADDLLAGGNLLYITQVQVTPDNLIVEIPHILGSDCPDKAERLVRFEAPEPDTTGEEEDDPEETTPVTSTTEKPVTTTTTADVAETTTTTTSGTTTAMTATESGTSTTVSTTGSTTTLTATTTTGTGEESTTTTASTIGSTTTTTVYTTSTKESTTASTTTTSATTETTDTTTASTKASTTDTTTDEPVSTTTTGTTTEQPDADLGDVNEDGKVDAKDASMVLVAYAKVSTGSEDGLTEKQRKAADVNNDGKVDAKDASSMLAYYALVSTASGDIPSMKEFMTPKQT